MAYRAVVFDMGGTLTEPLISAFVHAVPPPGLDTTALARVLLSVLASPGDGDEPGHRAERGEISLAELLDWAEEQVPGVREFMGPGGPADVFANLHLHPGMAELVGQVRGAGLRTAVLSNIIDGWVDDARTLLAELEFDLVCFSCEVGLRKPNPEIYHLVLRELGVEPHEAIFLDDFPAMVEGGAAVGMTAIAVRDHAAAIAEVRAALGL